MKRFSRTVYTASVAVCCLQLCGLACAADLTETARTLSEKARKTVVTIRLVSKLKMAFMGQNQDHEQKFEVTGTVIDASGLTVTDASSIDPTASIKSMLGGRGAQVSIESEIKETTIILDDGTEVDADVVLKDTDLGLAFIRPRDAKTFDAVTLKPRAKAPQLLDGVIALGRLGRIGHRAASVSTGTVKAIVKGPRTFYVCDNEVSMNPGCIAYGADGEPLGILIMKASDNPDAGGGGMGMMMSMAGGGRDLIMPILRPVDDIIEVAAQAKQAKPITKQTDDKKADKKEDTK